jgi:peptidoglycan hydrolase-like protein with peptidoglycan-binding domain
MKLLFKIQQSNAGSHRTRSVSPVALLQAAILSFSLQAMAAEEGPIYAVQDALKREQFFSGERTGVLDPPTRTALRRFQSRNGLPETGEIDTHTLQALQRSTEVGRPVIESRPPVTKESAPNPAIVSKDRQFLQNIEAAETAREQQIAASSDLSASPALPPSPAPNPEPIQSSEAVRSPQPAVNPPPPPLAALEAQPPPSPAQPAVTAPTVPDATAQPDRKAERRKREVSKNRPAEKPRQPDRRKVEELHRDPPIPPASSRVAESVEEPEPLDSGGVRIIRSKTITSPDGRTLTRTTSSPETVAPTVRRAERVEPRRKNEGFFDRLFKDDGNDNDDKDDD